MSNEAAWLKEAKAPLVVDKADMYTPGEGEMLVRVESMAFNPLEAKMQTLAMFPIPYPAILGVSFAGTVTALGPSVTQFSVGDHIAANVPNKSSHDPRFGAFQKYALASTTYSAKLAPSTPFGGAAATITNLATVAVALTVSLGVQRPPLKGEAERKGKKVLVYGGSSSCGGFGVKYAADAGYDVVTTSSPQNKDWVLKHNPTHVIDHTLPREKVLAELKALGPYDAIFDTIGTPEVTALMVEMLSEKGGRYATTLPPMGSQKVPGNVERVFASYFRVLEEDANEGLRKWFYEEYLPKGLENGQIIPTRRVEKRGLESVQGVLDELIKGVSGKKFVGNPWARG